MKLIHLIAIMPIVAGLMSCGGGEDLRLTASETSIINEGEGLMRVLTIADEADSLLLRCPSRPFLEEELQGDIYKKLASRMIATVTDPSQDGVGIAGPQVGLLRRVVAVQRFDKEGEPFEVYPNISLEPVGTEIVCGPEGCLSVPDMRGDVQRYSSVRITYTDSSTLESKSEVIEGFTAIIFQHECDHLEGILYIDRL